MYPENEYVAIFWFNDTIRDVCLGCYDQRDVDTHCEIARKYKQIHWVEWL